MAVSTTKKKNLIEQVSDVSGATTGNSNSTKKSTTTPVTSTGISTTPYSVNKNNSANVIKAVDTSGNVGTVIKPTASTGTTNVKTNLPVTTYTNSGTTASSSAGNKYTDNSGSAVNDYSGNTGGNTYGEYVNDEALKLAQENAQKYAAYNQGDMVNNAYNAWVNQSSMAPGSWSGGNYLSGLQSTMDSINNREAFNYDLNADILYQQYKDQYMREGNLAMQDTLGKAAALTGGYGSSYGVTAGNQAYQSYLGKLNDVIPDLYQLAYDKYNTETNDLYNRYNMYKDAYDTEYNEYRNQVNDWYTENQRLQNVYLNLYNNERSAYESDRDYNYKVSSDAYDNAFNKYKYDTTLAEDQRQFDASQLQNQKQFDKELAYKEAIAKANATTGTSTNTSSSASDNEYLSQAQTDLQYLINHGGTYDSLTEMLKYERDAGNITPEEYDVLFAMVDQAHNSGKIKWN